MTWFKVDDRLWGHPKWLGLRAGPRALWVTAGSWCAANLTDGIVPRNVLPSLKSTIRDAEALVEAGLWWPLDDGWIFHDWHEYQPSRESVEDRQAAQRERQRRWREARNRTPVEDDTSTARAPHEDHTSTAWQPSGNHSLKAHDDLVLRIVSDK